MSSEKSSERPKSSKTNPNLKSSIVHKPFATGTINIFNPYRRKGKDKDNKETNTNKLSPPKLFLNAELEQDFERRKAELELTELELQPEEIEYRERNWIDSLLSPWGISAIAMLLSVNLISAGFLWRDTRNRVEIESDLSPTATVGNRDFGDREFMPLNLSTLGAIEIEDEETESTPDLIPIAPALAPINNIASLSSFNTPYHYVLTEYTGEESLGLAQKQVKQVSLVNFPQGVFIYLGAFKDRKDAEQFVSQLKQKTLSAHVYPIK